jgi:WD40 repeat protein
LFWLDSQRTRAVPGATSTSAIATTGELLVRDRDRARFAIRNLAGETEVLARVDYAEIPPAAALGGLSRDGHVACFLDARGAIVVEDRRTHHRTSFGPYPDGTLSALELSPSGARLALASDQGVVRTVELATGAARVVGRHDGRVLIVRFSADSGSLATGGLDGQVKIWDLLGGSIVVSGHTARVWDVAFSPDGRWLASASADGTVRTFERDGRPLAVLRGHAGPVLSVDVSPSGGEIVSTGIDGAVRRWSVETGQSCVIRRYPGAIWSGRYSADGRSFVATYRAGLLVTDPAVPQIPRGGLGPWLDGVTTATVDDTGRLETLTR